MPARICSLGAVSSSLGPWIIKLGLIFRPVCGLGSLQAWEEVLVWPKRLLFLPLRTNIRPIPSGFEALYLQLVTSKGQLGLDVLLALPTLCPDFWIHSRRLIRRSSIPQIWPPLGPLARSKPPLTRSHPRQRTQPAVATWGTAATSVAGGSERLLSYILQFLLVIVDCLPPPVYQIFHLLINFKTL